MQLKKTYPKIVSYDLDTGEVKLAAAWLIDHLGWKGKQHGAVAMHQLQALVLTNLGGDGQQVLSYAQAIQADVSSNFGIELEIEPRVC